MSYSAQSSVYPGLYAAVPERQLVADKIKNESRARKPINMPGRIRNEHHLMLEIALPGFDRQDIFVTGCDNLLSVIVLSGNMDSSSGKGASQKKHSHHQTYQKMFLLPANADGEFGSATYKDGHLAIHIPTGNPLPDHARSYRIMVY